MRLCCSLAVGAGWTVEQFDIVSTFTEAQPQTETHVVLSNFRRIVEGIPNGQVARLARNLYGDVFAPNSWYCALRNFLLDNGYSEVGGHPCCFVRRSRFLDGPPLSIVSRGHPLTVSTLQRCMLMISLVLLPRKRYTIGLRKFWESVSNLRLQAASVFASVSSFFSLRTIANLRSLSGNMRRISLLVSVANLRRLPWILKSSSRLLIVPSRTSDVVDRTT